MYTGPISELKLLEVTCNEKVVKLLRILLRRRLTTRFLDKYNQGYYCVVKLELLG